MDVGLLREAVDAALAVHTVECVGWFCGVSRVEADYWTRCRGFGISEGDEETFLANLRLLAETPDCPCRTGEAWEEWFGCGVDLPVLG